MISSSRISERPSVLAVCGLLVAIATLIAAPGATARNWPAPVGFLSDFAGVVDPATGDSIQALAAELREKTGAEIAIVTTQDLGGEEIEPAAVDLFAQWKIGKKGRDEGVLILLAVAERRIKIEVGYGLEGILPDGRCGAIIRQVMGPDLSQNRFGTGLLRGEEAIAGVIAGDRGVTLDRGGRVVVPSSGSTGAHGIGVGVLLLVWLLVIVIAMAAARRRRARGWTGRRGWHDPWGGFGGGMGGMGGFGGFGGGGGGGGGFGGFGGGSSGGGGASGRF